MSRSESTLASTIPGEHIHISVDDCTAPFWTAAKERRLSAPRCGDCGRFRMPPTPFCPQCQSRAMDWVDLTGAATVYSYAVVRGLPQFPDLVLVAAVLDLPDAPGARIVSNVVDVAPEEVSIGMHVEVDFMPIADGWLLPAFRPAAGD
ncbi:Uncharacterised protein [Mycolicibacterium vanbaalenii]|uniref:DUF35 domain-containing protein n=1 Tax=Mycolicibacterium vanbaalenii TaxID=110539 RepID=A0A5S9RCT4_MYCVN|nr:zinc ribbon domain-containing protein [Mycolicibacterium vanbaalenii]CAA0137587.1 Uncharacterised protein [Mycolicibacterium vanbaalenii]